MRNIRAVFTKQLISYIKNPARWGAPLTFLLLPFILVMMNPDVNRAVMPIQFVIMFVGISMIGGSAGILMEDKQTMNLRFMGMAGVKPWQYLLSTCAVLLVVSLGILFLFGLIMGHSGQIMINFLIVTMLGSACSMLLGITIGLSKLAPFTMIIGLLLGVGPVLAADFGIEALSNVFYYTHTYQINLALRDGVIGLPGTTNLYELVGDHNLATMDDLRVFLRELNTPRDLAVLPMGAIRVMLINMGVILLAFVAMNMRYGLDGERLGR